MSVDWAGGDLALMRADYAGERAKLRDQAPPDVKITVDSRPGLAGLHFTPPQASGAPILYFHGGSWMIGSPDTHRTLCAHLARACRRRVISVPYRLAPEHQWPAQYQDAGQRIAAANAHEGPVFVAGDSAGGAMALWAEAQGNALGVVAFYGAFGLTDSASLRRPGDQDLSLTCQGMVDIYARVGIDPPAQVRAKCTPTGAPILLIKATADPLADDNSALIADLPQRNITLREAPNQPHAFLHHAATNSVAREILSQTALWLDALDPSP